MPLTMENSGAALVAGAALPRNMRRVRVVRPFMLDGEPVAVDDVLTLPGPFAGEMLAGGKVVIQPDAAEEPAPKPAAKPPKAKD